MSFRSTTLALAILLATTELALASATLNSFGAQATNVLRYDFDVTTTEIAAVWVEFWESLASPTTAMKTPMTPSGTSHAGTIWGLKPSTTYACLLVVHPVGSSPYVGGRGTFTTSSLPAGFPTMAINQNADSLAESADIDYVLLAASDSASQNILFIADGAGNVVWYEYANALPGAPASAQYRGYSFDHRTKGILAIVDHTRIVKYEMNGDIEFDWSPGAPSDWPTSVYVHHDLRMHDGKLYVLAAREYSPGGGSTYVEDGYMVFSIQTTSLDHEWWATTGGMSLATDPSNVTNAGTAGGYWSGEFPTAVDWAHGNSIFPFESSGSDKVLISFRWLNQGILIDDSTIAVEGRIGQSGAGGAYSNGDFSLLDATGGASGDWWEAQHDVTVSREGVLLLFDNRTAGSMSRAYELTLDTSALTAQISRQSDFSAYTGGAFSGYCSYTGSCYPTDGGHIVATGGPESLVVEFDDAGLISWDLQTFQDSAMTTPCGWTTRGIPLADIGLAPAR